MSNKRIVTPPSCIPCVYTRHTSLGLLSKESAAGWGHSAHNNICSLDKILKRVSQCGKQIFTLLCLSYFIPRFSVLQYLLVVLLPSPATHAGPLHQTRPGKPDHNNGCCRYLHIGIKHFPRNSYLAQKKFFRLFTNICLLYTSPSPRDS